MQDEVAAAEKSIDEKTTQLISKGRWMVPGYKVRGSFVRGTRLSSTDTLYRRSLATWPLCNRPKRHLTGFPFVYSSIVDTRTRGGRRQSLLYPIHRIFPFLCEERLPFGSRVGAGECVQTSTIGRACRGKLTWRQRRWRRSHGRWFSYWKWMGCRQHLQ